MRIGELAQRTGVSVRSLRYYEQVGLLVSKRSRRDQRHYDEHAVDRVVLIQELLAAGMCSSKIARLIPCLEADPSNQTPVLVDELIAHRDWLTHGICDLQRANGVLDEVIDRVR